MLIYKTARPYFLLFSIICYVANIQAVIAQKEDSVLYEKYKNLRKKNLDSALVVAKSGILIADPSTILSVKFHNAMGWIYSEKKNSKLSLTFYQKGYRLSLKQKNHEWMSHLSNVIGSIYQQKSTYDSALFYYLESVKASHITGSKSDLGIGLVNIGLIYYKLSITDQAIEYLLSGINELKDLEEAKEFLVPSYINVALAYGVRDKTLAIEYFRKANSLCETNPGLCTPKMTLDINYNLAVSLFESGEFKMSFINLTKSFKDATLLNEAIPISTITYYLSRLAEINGDHDSSRYWLRISDRYAIKSNSLERQKNNSWMWAKIYESAGIYDSSLLFRKEYDRLKDSVLQGDLLKEIKAINIHEQKILNDTILKTKDKEISSSKTMVGLLIVILSLAFALSYFLYEGYKTKSKNSRKLEETVQVRTAELKATNDQLSISKKDLDTYIYRLSHNIKAPLTTLIGLTNIAKMDIEDKVTKDYLEKIDNTAHRLNDILTELIRVTHILNTPLKVEPVSILQILNDARKNNDTKDYYPRIKWLVKGEVNAFILTDKKVIEVILSNIIDNAYSFINESEIDPYIKINIEDDGYKLYVTIEDNGRGIVESAKNNVFDLFYVADNKHGMGLGLFEARIAAERIKAVITISSANNPTVFSITIPYKEFHK